MMGVKSSYICIPLVCNNNKTESHPSSTLFFFSLEGLVKGGPGDLAAEDARELRENGVSLGGLQLV